VLPHPLRLVSTHRPPDSTRKLVRETVFHLGPHLARVYDRKVAGDFMLVSKAYVFGGWTGFWSVNLTHAIRPSSITL
jgi:hypothetical protein